MAGLFDDLTPGQGAGAPAPVYGPGSAYSGQPAAAPQGVSAYVQSRDVTAPAGSATNPSFDTPDITGADSSYHVDQQGRLHAPAADVNVGMFGDLVPGGAPATGVNAAHPDFALGLYQGVMKPFDNAAKGAEWALSKAGVPMAALDSALGMPTAQEAAAAHTAFIGRQAQGGKTPGFWGNLTGNVVGTLPLVAGMGPLAGGAVTGALTTNATTLPGIALDTALGAAGGKVADGALGFVKGMVSPTVGDSAKALLNEGIGLTPGQIAGGALKRVEDGATSIPILGDIIKNAQARSLSDFNRAAINRSLTPIGDQLPGHLPSGYDAVDYAHQALSNAYDKLVPDLTARTDPAFTAGVGNLRSLAQNLTPDYANKFNNVLQNEVLGRFAPQTGVITGESLKDAESQLGQQAARFGKIQDGHAQDYADAVRELQSQLRGLVQRQNPAIAGQLGAINSGWANLVRVESAAGRQGATGGVFTPSQLEGAARAADNSVRKSATARGGALMQDLATAGKEVLPASVPDSGSPYRHAMEALVALLVGQEAHALPLMLKGAAAGGVLGSAYTRAGQKVITPLMTARPAAADQVANFLARYKAPAVPAGSAAAVAIRNAGTN